MAHTRLADHQGSTWNRIAAPVLGSGVHINEQAVERVALECGWQSTWMTELVSTYAKRKARARQSSEAQGRLTFAPAPVAPSEGRVPDSVVSDSGPLPTPAQSSNPSQAADGSGAGEQGRVPFNSHLRPLKLLLVLIQARQPMAARLHEGNKAQCQLIVMLLPWMTMAQCQNRHRSAPVKRSGK